MSLVLLNDIGNTNDSNTNDVRTLKQHMLPVLADSQSVMVPI